MAHGVYGTRTTRRRQERRHARAGVGRHPDQDPAHYVPRLDDSYVARAPNDRGGKGPHMSAYVVGNPHINALVNLALFGPSDWSGIPGMWPQPSWFPAPMTRECFLRVMPMRRQISRTCAQEVGQLLMDQNIRSVNCRYEENQEPPTIFDWQPRAARPTALEGLHAVDCYEYQSSEDPAWLVSEAYPLCGALRAMLVLALPGYREAASWAWGG